MSDNSIDLKTVTLNLIKKNRVYFKCENEKGYEVKLKITPESENMELGTHTLFVEDLTVRSKYGTEVIYAVKSELKEEDGIVTLSHRYNKKLVKKCNELGGKWDSSLRVWVFPEIVEDKVEELDYLYNSNVVDIEITALEDIYNGQDSVYFLGYPIAKATGRDSGATICDDISMIQGKVLSGGSSKNWSTEIKKGSIFRLRVSTNLLDDYTSEEWKVLNI